MKQTPQINSCLCCGFCKWSVSRTCTSVKANPSYLWVEAYLTDVAGDDWPLCLHQRWPEGVRHHSLLDGVHLRRDSPEDTSKIQHHRRNSEASASPNCSALKGSTEWMRMRGKGAGEKVQVNDKLWRGRKLVDKIELGGKTKWRGSSDWCGQEGVCFLRSSCCCCCVCLSSWVPFKRFNSC